MTLAVSSITLFSNVLTRAYIYVWGIMDRSLLKICRTAPYDPRYYEDANRDTPKSYKFFFAIYASLWCDPFEA